MGAPSKLTPALIQRMEQAVLLAAHKKHVAGYMGVTYETFRAWFERGRTELERREAHPDEVNEGEALYVALYQGYEMARARAAVALLTRIHAASPTEWRAAIALLEKAFPAEYGRRKALELSADEETVRHIVKIVRGIDIERV